jgi:hypothetical protein
MDPLQLANETDQQEIEFPKIFHIYHTGPNEVSYAIHAISDSHTTLNLELKPKASHDQDNSSRKGFLKRSSTASNVSTKIRRAKAYDDPKYDPRTETSPYFVHLPILYGHCPPYTLRCGGKKSSPTACIMHPLAFWRGWRLEFGDILSQEGVVDGRGVVSLKYGTQHGEDGTLKGYKVRKRRYRGESGKAWFHQQQQQQQNVKPETTTASQKVKPEEALLMQWSSPFSLHPREYHFMWRGFKFIWKGTTNVNTRTRKILRPFLRFNHLKLVVIIPSKDDGEKQIPAEEIPLARYVSVASNRKAGRLEVYTDAINSFLSRHIETTRTEEPQNAQDNLCHNEKSTNIEALNVDSSVKVHQRMQDLIVSSGMCMVIGEYKKRQILLEIILLALTGADT